MPSIIAYRKFSDQTTTRELPLPEDKPSHAPIGIELATLAGITYVAIPDGAVLPDEQHNEIIGTITPAVMSPALRAALKAASPHVRFITARLIEAIRERYSIDEELQLLRTRPSQEFDAYNAFVETTRPAPAVQKATLGL